MDSIDLQDFGTTLAVGIFTLASLAILAVTFNPAIKATVRRYLSPKGTFEGAIIAVTLSAALLALGIFSEDISEKFSDADIGSYIPDFVPSEHTIRERAFSSKLAAELAASGRISGAQHDAAARTVATSFEKAPTQENWDALSKEHKKKVVSGLYYRANNTLHRMENFRNELAVIKARSDFSRSFAIIAATFTIVTIILAAAQMLWAWSRNYHSLHLRRPRPANGRRAPNRPPQIAIKPIFKRWARLIPVYLAIYGLTTFAFYSEEYQYDIRVFGYYATLDEDDLPKISFGAHNTSAIASHFPGGISEMVRVGNQHLLIVHDTKDNADVNVPRVSLVDTITRASCKLSILGTHGIEILPSDLEAACAVPNRPNELLLCESGYYTDPRSSQPAHVRNGRVFWVRYDPATFKLHLVRLLFWPPGTEDIEAATCMIWNSGLTLVAATRDGVVSHSHDLDKIQDGGIISLAKFSNALSPEIRQALTAAGTSRPITAFHMDPNGVLWAAASHEPQGSTGDTGPFRSVIYPLGKLSTSTALPIEFKKTLQTSYVCEGVKVEALASGDTPYSLIYGTDDEDFGGIWRPLPL